MTSLQEVRRVVQARLDKFQPAQRSWDAYLGDGNGTINDESQPFHTYVRYPAANSPATSITNTRVPAQIENLRIKVGYLPEQPTLLQVLSVVPDQRLDDAGGLALLPTHAPTHVYGGSDPVYVVWRQIGDFRLYATGGLQVTLQGGIATIAGTVTTISTQLVDLTDSVPTTGARWSLISIKSTGAVTVTDGTPQTTATALTFAHIPATPSGEWRIWAIKLQESQTVIDESRLFVDTLDLRWPQNVGAGSVALSDLAAGSAQYQYIVTGATPFTPAWSTGFLNITATKTLSTTGTLTLTPSSDGLTLTVPKTGTVATGTGTAGRIAEWVTDANTLQASTLLKTGAGTLEIQSASGTNTFNAIGDIYVSKASPSSGVFEVGHAASSTVLQLYHGKSLVVQNILTLAGSSDSLTLTVPTTGTAALGAGTLTVSTTNAVATATHTHAITSASNSNSVAAILASDSTGALQLISSPTLTAASPSKQALSVQLAGDATENLTSGAEYSLFFLNTPTGTGNHWNPVGVGGIIRHIGSGNISAAAYPGLFQMQLANAGGTVAFCATILLNSPLRLSGDKTITLNDGLYVANMGAAFVGTSHGIYMDTQTGSASPYAIYTNGGINRLGDQLSIAGSADRQQLIVTGYTTQAVSTSLVQFTRNDAAAGVSAMLGLTALGSGSNGDGGSILMNGKSSTTAAQSMAALKWLWVDATHASRKARVIGTLYDTAERQWLQVDTDGSSADVLIDSLIYGSMYADDITQAVTVAASGTYYKVPGSMTVGACNGFTLASSRELTCTIAGTYHVVWGMSITSATNNENISGAAMVNTTEVHQSEGGAECINSTKPVHVSGSACVTLAVNDVLALCVENESAAHDITVYHANLTAVRIGA